jgi:sensor histidine kinase YesM
MRSKVLALCVSCTLLALGLQALFFQSSASSILYQREREAGRKSLESMQGELYMWIKSYENDLIKIYNKTDFIGDLSSSGGAAGAMAVLRDRYRRIAYDLALTVFDASQQVSALYVYGADGELLSSYRSTSTPLSNYPEDIFSDRAAYNANAVSSYILSDRRAMLVSSYFNQSRKREIVRLALKVYAKDASRKIGCVVCDVDAESFRSIVRKYLLSDDQIVWLQPVGDRPVLGYGESAGRQKRYYDEATAAIGSGRRPDDGIAQFRDSVLFGIPQEKYDLTPFSLTPNRILEESQRALARNLLLIALLVVAVAVFGAAAVAVSLTRPLTRICGTLKRIRDGETGLRLEGLKDDEVGELGRAANEMLDRIQALIAEEYDAKLLLKQAEYRALQAQVNPHFLYNTLDTMAGIALAGGCPEVGDICRALSNMFRYAIDAKESLATVRSEIVSVKNYMRVMNARMKGGVDLEIRVDRGILGERVPRLCLQPLVENSLLHGLRDKRGAKRLAIVGEEAGGGIVLSVEDNGVGMEEREIEAALAGSADEALEGGSSIGLRNIDSRIKILFGEGYGVRIRSSPGEGCTVSIAVPRVPVSAEEGEPA